MFTKMGKFYTKTRRKLKKKCLVEFSSLLVNTLCLDCFPVCCQLILYISNDYVAIISKAISLSNIFRNADLSFTWFSSALSEGLNVIFHQKWSESHVTGTWLWSSPVTLAVLLNSKCDFDCTYIAWGNHLGSLSYRQLVSMSCGMQLFHLALHPPWSVDHLPNIEIHCLSEHIGGVP
jgi:hypothetical protein